MTARAGWVLVLVLGAAALTAGPGRAEVVQRHANGFALRMTAPADADWTQAYAAVGDVTHWWNGSHTYSGDAANLSLPLVVGACLCERLADGTTFEHGRVIAVTRQREVRLAAPLGPLNGKASKAELTFGWAPNARGGVMLTLTFEVEGEGLGAFAAPVDQVMMDQFQRWAAWAPRVLLSGSTPQGPSRTQ